ncbi:MAG TPA: 4-alpha-glucanotransferase [Pyrinomonadaceae bacterium]|nr:4-alpha-glucanotransferase [Pyrinomonadaceae bacterium]
MSFSRSSGVLLHPTSLPGRYGVGDLGEEAQRFIDFLAASGQTLWQVLPLGPTGYGDSPYQSFSAFAGNTLLVSPDRLVSEGLLDAHDLADPPAFSPERVDFGAAIEFKNKLLRRAFENFRRATDTSLRGAFEDFSRREAAWLDDYALYRAMKDARSGVAWNRWEPPMVRRDPQALAAAREGLAEQVSAQKFYQFLFFKQWHALKRYANERGVSVIGDIPIFVAHDSADVWTHPHLFKLKEDGSPRVVAGVPPDYFSATGQLWGNPLYDWERLGAEDFRWWIARVSAMLRMVDILRIDHFRGFAASWEIPGGDTTAERGQWVDAPGRELFEAIKRALGTLPILAEDLGVITPDVEALRDDFNFPGMRILQFAFGGDTRNTDLPHNYHRDVAVYTGTHDNDTTVGWFTSPPGMNSTRTPAEIERERKFCLDYLNADGREIHWDFIRAVLASVGNIAIIPLQDILGLGNDARMNLPNSTSGNWSWRYAPGALDGDLRERLKALTELYGRNLKVEAGAPKPDEH